MLPNFRYKREVRTWSMNLRYKVEERTWRINLRYELFFGDSTYNYETRGCCFCFHQKLCSVFFFPLLLLLRFSLSILLVFQMGTLFWVSIPTNPFPDCLWQRLGKSTKRCTHVQLGEEITMKTLAKLIMHREFAKTMKTRKFSIKMDSHSVRFYHFLSHFEI